MAAERFWQKVDKSGKCWEWTATTSKQRLGYGRFWDNGTLVCAHRYSYELENGPVPDGFLVLHRCDNSLCVRPDHLYLGTQFDNMHDMKRRGRERKAYGSDNKSTKLNPEIVRVVRKLAGRITYNEIGELWGISKGHVGHIVRGDIWSHVA